MNSPSDAVFHSRAVRSMGISIEDDPDPMVHQQLARLFFLSQLVDLKSKRILEFGCGSGLNCDFLMRWCAAQEVVGFDLSRDSVVLAKKQYPDLTFLCADACDPALHLSLASWDLVVSFEVLEHVPRMDTFLRNVHSHLAPGGIAFITTPNRAVFSLGYEPSPVNREHMKELSREEFESLLSPFFSQREIWGQGFKRKELLDVWKTDVQEKIVQCKAGTRWQTSPPLREKLQRIRLVNKAYQNPFLQKSWKYLRWTLLQQVEDKRAIRRRPYSLADFEFSADTSNAVWFCALLKP